MDGGHHGGADQAAVGEWHEVEVVRDDVELVGPLEDCRVVESLPDFGVHGGVFLVPGWSGTAQGRGRCGVSGGEEGDVVAGSHEAFRKRRGDLLPRPIAGRW